MSKNTKQLKKLAKELREVLTEDILNRYDNSEYWEPELIESFMQENQLNENEREILQEEFPN